MTDSRRGLPPFAADWAFFLDVDGTLLELASRPDEVVVRPRLPGILQKLAHVTSGAVALISGRPIADLDRLFTPLRFAAAGLHGIERRDHDGAMHYHHQLDGKLDHTRELLARLAGEHEGLLFEDKQFSIAIHYRQAPDKEPLIRSFLEQHMPEIEQDFHLQKGKMVYEIKPSGRDKGMAIEEFMQEAPFRRRIPVFIGDDVTDEDGFATVNKMHGYSIKVGYGDTAARWSLPDTAAVMDLLDAYVSFMHNRQQSQQ
jgi:trehalose 6-phosphate phosphatase